MDKIGIKGISLTPLKIFHNEQGSIYHGIKKSDSDFLMFGEAYFSSIKKNTIKGWNKHSKMTINLIVCLGKVEFVVFDDRDNSPSKGKYFNCTLSISNYNRLKIEQGLWVAFRGLNDHNMILNIANFEHDPNELEKLPIESFQYNW